MSTGLINSARQQVLGNGNIREVLKALSTMFAARGLAQVPLVAATKASGGASASTAKSREKKVRNVFVEASFSLHLQQLSSSNNVALRLLADPRVPLP